jgi:hypothetical protein
MYRLCFHTPTPLANSNMCVGEPFMDSPSIDILLLIECRPIDAGSDEDRNGGS